MRPTRFFRISVVLGRAACLAAAYQPAAGSADAIAQFEKALSLRASKVGMDHPHTILARSLIVAAYDKIDQLASSERLYLENLDQTRKRFGPQDARTARAMVALPLPGGKSWA
jgi:hypothetical protein